MLSGSATTRSADGSEGILCQKSAKLIVNMESQIDLRPIPVSYMYIYLSEPPQKSSKHEKLNPPPHKTTTHSDVMLTSQIS